MAIDSSLAGQKKKQQQPERSKKSSAPKEKFREWPSPDFYKQTDQGGSESEASATSSNYGSTSSGTSSQGQDKIITEEIQQNTPLKKSKSKKFSIFGSFRSSRARTNSRFSQASTSDASPDHFQESPQKLGTSTDTSGSTNGTSRDSQSHSEPSVGISIQKLPRASSLRRLRLSRNKSKNGSKSNRPLAEKCSEVSQDLNLERATCSSTLKGSKFPNKIELNPESQPKVCPYHHCSLHGHHHHDAPEDPPKRLVFQRRHPVKVQDTVDNKSQSRMPVKQSGYRREEVKEPKTVQKATFRKKVASQEDKKGMDYSIEFYEKTRSEPVAATSRDIYDADIAEILFGVNRFQENLRDLDRSISDVISIDMKADEKLRTSDEKVPNLKSLSSNDSSKVQGADNGIVGNSNVSDLEESKPQSKKGNQMSMWYKIHQQMVSGLAAESGNKLLEQDDEMRLPSDNANKMPETKCLGTQTDFCDSDLGTQNNEAATQEVEVRKMFAIKMVREAIEKILLPEVHDDQSSTSEVTSEDQEISTKSNGDEISEKEKGKDDWLIVEREATKSATESGQLEEKGPAKVEKKSPKSWSYLKKVILLNKFIKELEKVKKFNRKKSTDPLLEAETEAEMVSLRRQLMLEKKNADEWMLDYALRQAVSELAPTQKKKVALLVKAFETVAPSQEDQPMKVAVPKPRDRKSKDSCQQLDKHNSDSKDADVHLKETVTEEKNKESENEGIATRELLSSKVYNSESTHKVGKSTDLRNKYHIKMWHMIYHHVAADIAAKVGTGLLLDGTDEADKAYDACNDDFITDNPDIKEHDDVSNRKLEFTRSDAVKLVQEAVNEILVPDIQDDLSDISSVASDILPDQELLEHTDDRDGKFGDSTEKEREASVAGNKLGQQKSKNWSKLKKLILLKRSIKVLENVRILNSHPPEQQFLTSDPEAEKIELRKQMMEERKKAEQWMLDYAVQHIVTKLNPARKRRVAMLVEAFEAVVPLPEF